MVLELNITPNRGDAMSVIGVAREVAALSGGQVRGPAGPAVEESSATPLASASMRRPDARSLSDASFAASTTK